jgi:hypothetical protein
MNQAFTHDDRCDEQDTSLIGKDGSIWSLLNQNESTRIRNRIVFTEKAGPTSHAIKHINETALSAFLMIFDSSMIKKIANYSNKEADSHFDPIQIKDIDILAFIGILFCRGVFCQKLSTRTMWSNLYGLGIVKSLMSRLNFGKIMKYLRFDDKSERRSSSRSNTDKFMLIRDTWDRFINNCLNCYYPNKYLTVDEQLLPCKTRCKFIQFMPNKPDKFGIKFWLLVEVKSKYICNAYPYLGKEDRYSAELQGESVVKTLSKPFNKNGHCIVMDNFFTSQKLAEYLLTQKTLLLGTLNKKKREIPLIAKKKQTLFDTTFLENENGTMMCIYQCKKKKNVLLLTTEHEIAHVSQSEANQKKKKPTIVHDYNKKKVGVDSVDQMSRIYNVKSATRRWPVCVFYNILNLAGINSWILYKKVNKCDIKRKNFLIKLIEEIKAEVDSKIIKTPPTKRKTLSIVSPSSLVSPSPSTSLAAISIR